MIARRGVVRLLLAGLLCAAAPVRAGVLTRARLAELFPAPYSVGEREKDVPVWPIFRQSGPPAFTVDLAGYVFESIDLAPVPGFSGTPIDLLVAIDTAGSFLDVRVLSQHEPVFVGGLGEEPLVNFVARYRGLNLKQAITIGSGTVRTGAGSGGTHVHLDGIAKATASLRIINQSVLSSALKVARARLGYAGARDPDLIARVRTDLFEPQRWSDLVGKGLIAHLSLRNGEVEAAFSGTALAGTDPAPPAEVFVDLYAALATVPIAGQNLLSDAGWASLQARTNPGDHVLLIMAKGRYDILGEDFVRNSVPDRLSLSQSGLALEMRDLDLDAQLRPVGQPAFDTWRAFRVIEQAGLDPGTPMQVSLRVTRARGLMHPEKVSHDFPLELAVPAKFLVVATDQKGWRAAWRDRAWEVGILLSSLALLSWVLARESKLVSSLLHLRWFRPVFLAYTVAFIGWFAQGQLSIVNVVAALEAAVAGRSLAFFLYDPVSIVLWAFTLVSLFVWGRGTFCGWLCPFGALQELAAGLGRLVRLPTVRPGPRADRWLKRGKYLVLAAVLAAAAVAPGWRDGAVEVEPFKTAITLHFARHWPFALYAAALLVLGVVTYKSFCRYLCPLGAFLALAGALRRHGWIARRAECGAPCQTCRHRCAYQAIDAAGSVDYAECFQCMECVAIYQDDHACAARLIERKGRRMLPIVRATG
jgi:NosR/NirI family transcriptional regulator, nitrous oxide reductase regulator